MRKRRDGFFRRIAGGVVSARQRRAARARGVVRACTAAALALAIAPALAHECRILGNSYLRGSYEGDCEEKSELAEGKGEARGADHYVGNFVKGRPDGKGVYTWENGARLEGTFKAGKGCIHVRRLDDIQLPVLEALLAGSVAHLRKQFP